MAQIASLKIGTNRCDACGMRFSLLNLFANLIMGIIKGVVGFVSGSHALKAGALYSINDVLTAVIVIVGLKAGAGVRPTRNTPTATVKRSSSPLP